MFDVGLVSTSSYSFWSILAKRTSSNSSSDLLNVVLSNARDLELDIIEDFFPSRADLDRMLDDLPSGAHTSLAVLDPLALPSPSHEDEVDSPSPSELDRKGFSIYARVVEALLEYVSTDRLTAKENVWALRHALALSQYADDLLQTPGAHAVAFGPQVPANDLLEIIAKAQQLTAYVLSTTTDEGWLASVATCLLEGKAPLAEDGIGNLLYDLMRGKNAQDTVRESRILYVVLQHTLSSASKSEADQFILLARKLDAIGQPSPLHSPLPSTYTCLQLLT